MGELFYSLEPDERFLRIKIEEVPPGKKNLSKETLLALAKGAEKELILFLIKEELRLLGTHQANTASLNNLRISSGSAQEAIKRLALTGRLLWKGRKLIVDPFSVLECEKGKWKLGGRSGDLSAAEAIIPGDPPAMIQNGVLQFFSPSADLDQTDVEQEENIQPFPFLKLQDRNGAFADLWFDYGKQGKVSFHDPRKTSWRQMGAERGSAYDWMGASATR